MSSDGYFSDDFDAAALDQIAAIEAAALNTQASAPRQQQQSSRRPLRADSSIDIDLTLDFDEGELQALDAFVEKAYNGQAAPVAGPSRQFNRTSSSNLVQTTLFGGVVAASTNKNKPASSSQARAPFGQQAKKTLQWDHTAFAESGARKKKKGKGKGKGKEDEEEDDDALDLPALFVPTGPWPPPMKLKPDLLEAKHWIFPTNRAKRDYQYNIVKHCLFENTLVALPTGLGKTFIAGVVMLNYYRWYPEGKIIFLATTKPLVGQQVDACHETCGIPGSDGIELTGAVRSATRARAWEQKRVFYMTSQTLESDLKSGVCDPMDVILLVIDEAHHATGNHTYNQVVRFLMAKNPHFRILALTATPGNTPEKVQDIVNGLRISHIEIRNEQSLDIKPYIFEKIIKTHVLKPNATTVIIRDLLVKCIDKIATPLRADNLWIAPAMRLHPYQPMALLKERGNARYYRQLNQLSQLARAMLYLLTGCFSACHEYLAELQENEDAEIATGSKRRAVWKGDNNYQELMKQLSDIKAKASGGRVAHAKTDKLKDILIEYFGSRAPEPNAGGDPVVDDSRVIVFSSFRSVVEEIVAELDQHKPLIRAAAFVGQATDKKGRKGLKQKEQREMIERFKRGEFNVLVATCIGEEGLDIGEVDCTICYDSDKAPIRMVQRFGRTGRKRAGNVHLLLAESREEANMDTAKSTYSEVQKQITRGELYELYADVPRLLPDHVKPECVEKVMEIEKYNREESFGRSKSAGGGKKSASTAPKRKRNDDPGRNIPSNAPSSFTSANNIWKEFKKRKLADPVPEEERQPLQELDDDDDEDEDEDDSDDLGESVFDALRRRSKSEKAPTTTTKKDAPSMNLKRSKTDVPPRKKPRVTTSNAKEDEFTKSKPTARSLFGIPSDEDEVDRQGPERDKLLFGRKKSTSPGPSRRSSSTRATSVTAPSQNSGKGKLPEVIELSDTDDEFPVQETRPVSKPSRPASKQPSKAVSKQPPRSPQRATRPPVATTVHRNLSPTPPRKSPSPIPEEPTGDMSWLMDDDDDIGLDAFQVTASSPPPPAFRRPSPPRFERVDLGDESMEISAPVRHAPKASTSRVVFASSPEPKAKGRRKLGANAPSTVTVTTPHTSRRKPEMPPPALPARFQQQAHSSPEAPAMTQLPVRAGLAKRRRAFVNMPSSSDDEDLAPPPPSQGRLYHAPSTAVTPARKKGVLSKGKDKDKAVRSKTTIPKPSLLAKKRNPLFDGEAAHSGDEVSEGWSEGDEDEDEEDRAFIKNSPLTQASPSYNQALAYRHGLMTQAPNGGGGGPAFANGPARAHPFGRMSPRNRQRCYLPSSSPGPDGEDSEPNEYEFGSFVVRDDEISMEVVGSDDALLDL